METSRFDYVLPSELIAMRAAEPRDSARLMVAPTDGRGPWHARVRDLPEHLRPGDLLVFNRTRVFPARLIGRKDTGGAVEVLLIHRHDQPSPLGGERWSALIRGRVRVGTVVTIDDVRARVAALHDDGERVIDVDPGTDVVALAERVGRIPLPPYIGRDDEPADRDRYQTVFADRVGSVAAPTAALHFTEDLLANLRKMDVATAFVDLAIGLGTFRTVTAERIDEHRIHAERCDCPAETIAAVEACRARGGRVIAVGTTVVRTLETAAAQPGGLSPYHGWTSLYLHPPRQLVVVDGLMTNFHLPRSTLLMLVGCLTGVDRLLDLYRIAIAERYRFYSYGDAMLLLPPASA
jgi:S-adenosylmethionine:tRNA ribosyltransferase-isomerase